jgi:hypothetical protein
MLSVKLKIQYRLAFQTATIALELLVPERKTKVPHPAGSGLVEAVEVEILESSEKWTELKLADGTIIRTKPVVLSVLRLEGLYDQEGNPVYQIKSNLVMTASVPDALKQSAVTPSDKKH